jgi:integrase
MASVKVKFRPSTVNGKEGTLYYQVIHNRVVRQINTEYKLFVSEWDSHSETVVLHHLLTGQERNNYLLSIGSRIKWDKDRLNKIIHKLFQSGTFVTDDVVMRFHENRQELSFNAYISQQIARLKRLGKIRTSETYTAALRSFNGFINGKDVLFDQLNADLLAEYEAYLKGRGNTPNTISFYMRILKAVYNRAVEDGLTEQRHPFKSVYTGVERFAGDRIALESITVDWVRRYERFLLGEGKSRTTIGIHMRHLRAILNDACRCDAIKPAQYPFGRGKYEIQAGEGRKLALTLEQIGQIARYEDGNEATAKYRDYWLFLYLCNGINVADFVKLRYRDIVDGEICFVRQKTERTTKTRKEIRVAVVPQMQAIIDRWGNTPAPNNFIFPILDGSEDAVQSHAKTIAATGLINKRMRMIGEQLEIGNISTYTARHSFATVLKRAGANIAYISESLGHQDLKTTENYLASFEREEREKNAALLTNF